MCGKKLLPFCCLLLFCASVDGSWLDRWTVRGVVVQKIFQPFPISRSLGMDGSYKLEVRDEQGKVHRQMVPREVFQAYEIGDRFDSLGYPGNHVGVKVEPAKEPRPPKVRIAIKVDPSPAPPAAGPRDRFASIYFTQDMLPEREGF